MPDGNRIVIEHLKWETALASLESVKFGLSVTLKEADRLKRLEDSIPAVVELMGDKLTQYEYRKMRKRYPKMGSFELMAMVAKRRAEKNKRLEDFTISHGISGGFRV